VDRLLSFLNNDIGNSLILLTNSSAVLYFLASSINVGALTVAFSSHFFSASGCCFFTNGSILAFNSSILSANFHISHLAHCFDTFNISCCNSSGNLLNSALVIPRSSNHIWK
jgi:hypothetical protein